MFGARADFPEKSKVILQMFDDIQNQKEIEVYALFFAKICKLEVQMIIFPRLAKLNRLGRDVVSPEFLVRVHLKLKLAQDFAGAAPSFTDGLRRKVVSLQHLQNVLGFERRLLHMPVGFLFRYSPSL